MSCAWSGSQNSLSSRCFPFLFCRMVCSSLVARNFSSAHVAFSSAFARTMPVFWPFVAQSRTAYGVFAGGKRMLLAVRGITKSYGTIQVLQTVRFVINAGERIGLVGPNGVGKSTLLRLLMGEEEADAGSLAWGPAVEAGYLPQSTPDFYGRTIQDLILESVGHLRRLEERMRELEQAMSTGSGEQLPALLEEYGQVSASFQDAGGYDLEYRIETILAGLRLDYLSRDREVQSLSGGERARL